MVQVVWTVGFIGVASNAGAVEGSAAAGPVGGTDIRAAQLPPPGLYGGITVLGAKMTKIVDGRGQLLPGLNVNLTAKIAGVFLGYVPDVQLFGGSIGIFGVLPGGQECGRLVAVLPSRCVSGIGDAYVELSWSRSFGRLRPSRDPAALPIFEGLIVGLGIGAILPVGQYDARANINSGVSIGNKIFDLAPSAAITYTTAPLLAEGTEFSAKLYWNNYWTNPVTQHAC